jgi:hypothetical protein
MANFPGFFALTPLAISAKPMNRPEDPKTVDETVLDIEYTIHLGEQTSGQ